MMGPSYLLDTNIVIYLRMKRPEKVARRILELAPGDAGMSIITLGELLYGIAKSAKPQQARQGLAELTQFVPILPLPEAAAESYGLIRAELEKQGNRIGNNDLWIAAHAKTEGLTLVTNNEREFRRVRGLKIQNWAK